MGKFTFSKSGRKKSSVPQLTVTEPMSKAHKILGSMPLNIDAPVCVDEMPSPAISIGTFKSAARSSAASDDGLDDRMRSPRSDASWSSPSSLGFNAIGDGMGYGGARDAVLKKTQSASTMKSWPDKPNQPPSVSRRTSTPAMSKGLLSKAHRILDTDNAFDSTRSKKKPPKLDLSTIVPTRSSKKEPAHLDAVDPRNPNNAVKSPSILSPFVSPSGLQGDVRKMLKRRTKGSLRSLFPDMTSPVPGHSHQKDGPSDNSKLSTLYDHYEQMTFRQVMNQDLQSEDIHDDDRVPLDQERREVQVEHGLDWLHKPLPNASHKFEYSSSPGARSVSSRHTRTSKASKHTDRSLQEADFQEKSVLMLSSDSEDDVDLDASVKGRPPVPVRRSSDASNARPMLDKCPPKTSQSRRSLESRSSRQSSKRASFAPANTWITIPSADNSHPPPTVRSRSDSSYGETPRAPSPKGSLMSNNSTASGMTFQVGYGVQEAQAFTVLPARRRKEETVPSQAREKIAHRPPPHESTATSTDQITPPLSPDSVDYYVQSARSSLDGSGGQNRIMAVTRQEQMLISALRKKNQAMRENRLESRAQSLQETRQCQARDSNSSQATITQTTVFDFDFPVPPKFTKEQKRRSQASAVSERSSPSDRSRVYTQSDDGRYQTSSLERADTASQKSSLEQASQASQVSAEQDVVVFLDENDDEDDNELDESLEIATDFGPDAWGQSDDGQTPEQRDNVALKARPQPERPKNEKSSPPSGGLATVSEHDADHAEDTPRPDSPISPESFPPVKQHRTTISNMARLSAVGFMRRDNNEPGWWGDDD